MAAQLQGSAGDQYTAKGGAGEKAQQGEQQVQGHGQIKIRQCQAQQRGGAGKV